MKLEVGMYVRTPYGIRKIVNITKDDGYGKPRVKVIELDDFLNTGYKFNYKFYTDEKIIKECKASYNIIDILEVEDFVSTITGECAVIAGVYNDINSKKYLRLCNCIGEYYEDDIKSVITHEQMEQMAYKVEE